MSFFGTYSLQPDNEFRLSNHGLLHRIAIYHAGSHLNDFSIYATDLAKLVELRDALTAYVEGRISGADVSRTVEFADDSDLEIVLAERSLPQWPVA